VRLGTCIALELVVAAGAVAGVWVGVGQASRLAGHYLTSSEAVAATASPSPARITEAPVRLPRASLEISRPILVPNNVFGAHDDVLLEPLGAAPLSKLKLNHGGTSLSLRVEFANGSRASFKPEQIHPQSDPRREIAAYRIDRVLGIGRVPPAKAITFTLEEMIAAADPSHRTYIGDRLRDEGLVRKGVIHGELSWWVPEIRLAKLGPHRIDEKSGKALWTSYLQIGASIPDDVRPMVEQIAALVIYDVLIDNPDRWTGANTVMSPDGQVLFFMDNSMSFSIFGFGHESNLLALRRCQVFPRKLVGKLRELNIEMLTDAIAVPGLADHRLAPLLDGEEIRAILTRRDNMLRYIDQLIEEHGEDTVLALP
jgi:hypothetical protein